MKRLVSKPHNKCLLISDIFFGYFVLSIILHLYIQDFKCYCSLLTKLFILIVSQKFYLNYLFLISGH